MVRNRRALLVALLCVLAVSLAAATLANPQQPAGGSGIGGSGPDSSGTAAQSGDGGDGLDNPEPADGEEMFRLEPVCVPVLATPAAGFAILGFALALGLVAYWRDGIAPAFRRLEARGNPVTVVSPDVTGSDTLGQQVARIERATRIRSLRRAGVRVVDWPTEDSFPVAVATARRGWSQ
ncbi:hypothetical protein [Halobacterium sp. KA-6]|uniref:hypothetical protein n=1 Tax=Halobacterium sp. KA-6 TaxID=2896368 RepID=UPI001E5B7970|nr:hypothetical protein [Halobacterium sp. KA-6]MCD2201940.1 hypothetical protein [Halobacterium sp. KA-6]